MSYEEDSEHYYRYLNDTTSLERAEEKLKRGMMKRSSSIDGSLTGIGAYMLGPDSNVSTPPFPALPTDASPHDIALQSPERSVSGSSAVGREEHDVREALFEAIPEPSMYGVITDFQRVSIGEVELHDADSVEASKKLQQCLNLRKKWMDLHPFPPQDLQTEFEGMPPPEPGTPVRKKMGEQPLFRRRVAPVYDVFLRPLPKNIDKELKFVMVDGVFQVHDESANVTDRDPTNTEPQNLFPVPTFAEFLEDFTCVRSTMYSGVVGTFCFKRLELLNARYNLHILLNGGLEVEAAKSVPHRDFYNVRKVDTHVHHSACMNQKHLLRFIKHKLKSEPNCEVAKGRDGKPQKLCEVFQRLGLTAYDLSIDTLDMHCYDTFQRFDRFNLKYNPAGQSVLREIFLKTDNFLNGKFLAELTLEVMDDLMKQKYQLAEWRVSIYGKNPNEWQKLAKWFFDNKLTCSNIRWLIQVPRLYQIYRNNNEVACFADMIHNIFNPLFEASANPEKYPEIHYFLETVVAFDSVDDESRPEHGRLTDPDICRPEDWTFKDNPPYGYWMFYMYANILALNKFRASRGLCTFAFRPHCGEAGDIEHMVSTFLLAHQINHGILLRKNTCLHYLYYLAQIGIAISPLSNNKLFLDYHKNPFIKYFRQGLNVSLSTDDPLMLHYTKDPLLEEYSVATQVWKLSSTDQCEIARLSVLQSGWEARYKLHYLGNDLNDPRETNVCQIRLSYRKETMETELKTIEKYASGLLKPNASPRNIIDQHPFSTISLPPPPATTTSLAANDVAQCQAPAPATAFSVLSNLAQLSMSQNA